MRQWLSGFAVLFLGACGSTQGALDRPLHMPCVHFHGNPRPDGITLPYESPVLLQGPMLKDILAQIHQEAVAPGDACVYLREGGTIEVVPRQGVGDFGYWFKFDGKRWVYFKTLQTGWVT